MKEVTTKTNNLETFLYILLRDHLTSGKVEAIMELHVEKMSEDQTTTFTNNYLYKHAADLAKRLKG